MSAKFKEEPEEIQEWVTMSHPGIEGTATATRQAFDEVWAPSGWVLVAEQGTATAPAATQEGQ